MARLDMLQLINMISNPEGVFGRKLWAGLWRGKVEDIDDPEQRGRMRVRIPAIHTEKGNVVPVEHLPWSEPCVQDAGQNYGEFHVPYRLGDWVWIMFEGGNQDYPVWLGSWFGLADDGGQLVSEIPEECRYPRKEAYPHRQMVFKSRRGHKMEVSDEKGELEIKITDSKGNFIWMDTEENHLYIWWNGNKTEIINGDQTVNIRGNKTEIIGGTHSRTIGGSDIKHVGQEEKHEVLLDRTQKVGGSDVNSTGGSHSIQAGGSQTIQASGIDHFGGTVRHNSGGSALTASPVAAIPPLPDPANTIEERKPAFPELMSNDDYPVNEAVPKKSGSPEVGFIDAASGQDIGEA